MMFSIDFCPSGIGLDVGTVSLDFCDSGTGRNANRSQVLFGEALLSLLGRWSLPFFRLGREGFHSDQECWLGYCFRSGDS